MKQKVTAYAIFYENLKAIYIRHETIFDSNFDIVLQNQDNFTQKEVKVIEMRDCILNRFPDCDTLLKIAKNLTKLRLYNCQLTKIDMGDLYGFEQLTYLDLSRNKLERLPKGLFVYTPKLEMVKFPFNRINWIHPNILEPLKNLKEFDLRCNDSFNKNFDVTTLAQLKQEINEKCKIPEETVNQKIDDNKKEINDLKKEIGGHKRKIDELKQARETQRRKIDQLEEIIKKRDFPDFTVKINEKDIRVNKAILAANSPLLAKMMNENKDADEIDLKDVSEDTFEMILAFMYNKTPPNIDANLIEVYGATGRLEMKKLMDITATMLLEQINPNNALNVLALCKKYGNKELEKKAFEELKKAYA